MLTRKEIARAYKIHPNTLTRRIRTMGINTRDLLTPKQVRIIFDTLGKPEGL